MMTTGTIKPDWTFELKGLSGRRVLLVNGLPTEWTLKAVNVDGTDVVDTGLEVKTGQEVSDIEVVVTNRVTEVSGVVQDAKGTAVPDFAVVVFPTDSQRWGFQSRYVRVARPDQTGRFQIKGLPPGSYVAAALEYLEPGEETNPEFLERLKSLGTSLRLDEAEKKALTLKRSTQ